MDLFKTEMLRFHPPQAERDVYRRHRSRYGCRSARKAALHPQPLAVAVRLALASSPVPSTSPSEAEAGDVAAAA